MRQNQYGTQSRRILCNRYPGTATAFHPGAGTTMKEQPDLMAGCNDMEKLDIP
jgi:hypothetical protein